METERCEIEGCGQVAVSRLEVGLRFVPADGVQRFGPARQGMTMPLAVCRVHAELERLPE